jgi:hypothetical protein
MLYHLTSRLLKTSVLIGLFSALALLGQIKTTLAADIIEAVPVSHSVVIINQTSGAVTQCTGVFNLTLQQPQGSCSQIGTVTPPPAGTSFVTKNEDYFVFILNSTSRTLYACVANFNNQTSAPSGSCQIAMMNVP